MYIRQLKKGEYGAPADGFYIFKNGERIGGPFSRKVAEAIADRFGNKSDADYDNFMPRQ